MQGDIVRNDGLRTPFVSSLRLHLRIRGCTSARRCSSNTIRLLSGRAPARRWSSNAIVSFSYNCTCVYAGRHRRDGVLPTPSVSSLRLHLCIRGYTSARRSGVAAGLLKDDIPKGSGAQSEQCTGQALVYIEPDYVLACHGFCTARIAIWSPMFYLGPRSITMIAIIFEDRLRN